MQKLSLSTSFVVLGIAIILAVMTLAGVVQANPSFFTRQNDGTGTTATSTPLGFLSVGAATTTIYLDSQSSGSAYGAGSATLLWQMTASSTNSTQDLYIEYAQGSGTNCITTPTACDWYYTALASTSPANINVSNVSTIPFTRWQFTNIRQGLLGGVTSDTRGLRIIDIPVPTRYVRAHFVTPNLTAAGTASSSSVWAEFVATKEDK